MLMISRQQEIGTYLLPGSEWTGFRSKLIASWNLHQTKRYRLAQALYKYLIAEARGDRNFNYAGRFGPALRAGKLLPGEPLDEYCDLYEKLFSRNCNAPREPHEHDYPLVGTRHSEITLALPQAGILLSATSHEAHWNANCLKTPIEKVREHRIAEIFFGALPSVKWTSRSGGYVLYTEERSGSGVKSPTMSSIRDAYGQLGTMAVAARAQSKPTASAVRVLRPGMR